MRFDAYMTALRSNFSLSVDFMIKNKHKHLNEIPNRYHFIELIEQVASNGGQFSVMFLDVMRFSDVSSAFESQSG